MEEQGAELICVVANVAEETAHGEGGLELRRGVKHFAPGAKVWVLPPLWGDGGEHVMVVGYHRGSRGRRLARMVMPRRHLTGFRVQAVYSPAVVRELTRPTTEFSEDPGPGMWATRKEAEKIAERWRDYPLEARLDGRAYTAVSDPPPPQLSRGGRTYYLAHFNAYRAIYSAEPPAEEIQLPG